MNSFFRKPITTIEPLGVKLRKARQSLHLTIEAVGTRSGIPTKYLHALEEGRYRELPGDVYVKNFLKTYAQLLHLSETRLYSLYQGERRVVRSIGPEPLPPTAMRQPVIVNWQSLLRRLGIGLGVALLLVYLGVKVQKIVQPPSLVVTTPSQDLIVTEQRLQVEGQTEPESTVRINGQVVLLEPNGWFSEPIDLQLGVNIIKISSQKERSREHVVFRSVIVQLGTTSEAESFSTTTGIQP